MMQSKTRRSFASRACVPVVVWVLNCDFGGNKGLLHAMAACVDWSAPATWLSDRPTLPGRSRQDPEALAVGQGARVAFQTRELRLTQP